MKIINPLSLGALSSVKESHATQVKILLLLFVLLSSLYSIIVPPFEASDELWHYPMVKYIADNWALPVQDPENVGAWRQEGSQAPLYYFIGALATFWIDTSDMGVVRLENPHADNGVATVDGNVNLITHHPTAETFPWRGTVLAVHVVRFLSVLMGAAAVYLTYRLALELTPGRPRLALAAAAIHAFTPMFVFVSGAVNNDNLMIPLCSLSLLLMVRLIKQTQHTSPSAPLRELESRNTQHASPSAPLRGLESRNTPPVSRFIPLGLTVGLLLLTKYSAGFIVVLTALTVGYVAWRERSLLTFFVGGLTTGGLTALIAGWWFLRNWRLYGEPLGQKVFIEILGQRDVPADLAQLWRERVSFVRGYWGNFGGLNVPMADWVYVALDVFVILATLGLILALARKLESANSPIRQFANSLIWFIVLLWPVLVVLPWFNWAKTTWSSQGRLIFAAISVWSLLLALGWRALTDLLPKKLRLFIFVSVPLFMFVISLAAPFVWIRPAYARPPRLADTQLDAIPQPQRVDAVFFHPSGGQLKLLGYRAPVTSAYPGQSIPVTLYWEAIEPFNRDYSIFVHLLDENGLIVAQRDAFPGMGTLSTRWLTPGRRWAERRVLSLPETAYSPNRANLAVGLYDYVTGERLPVVDAGGEATGDHVRFELIEVLSRPGDWPNPISIDWGDEMELVGYDLTRRALRPGETTTLTLYWRAQRAIETNYSISTQLVDRYGVKAAQKDAWPFDGARPTSTWPPDELVAEPRALRIFKDAPPGVYDVYVAVYPSDDPDALLVVTPPGGRLQTDHVVLTTLRVLP